MAPREESLPIRIGDRVRKSSNLPFKSGLLTATVAGFVVNEHDPKQRPAAKFVEDGSFVNVEILVRV